MNILDRFKSYDIMFYISLIWLAFPLYFSLNGDYPIHNLYLTLLMAFCYIACLLTKKNRYLNMMWLYMAIYIIYSSYFSPYSVMMLMYLSSLLNYKYKEVKLFSFRSWIFFLTGLVIFIYYIYLLNQGKSLALVGFIIISVCYFMHIATRAAVISEQAEYEKIEQNKYINNLLAENERNRIGRDLHDTLGHVFVMLSLKADLIEKLLDKNKTDEAKKEANELGNISRLSMKRVREIISNLKHRSLKEEIEAVRTLLLLANIKCEVNSDFEIDNLYPNIQSALSMILREVVNNILKHSEASQVSFTFYYEGNHIVFKVSDNGKGFDHIDGTELQSIKDRLLLLDGSVDILSHQQPTLIQVLIPLDIH